MVKSSTPDVSFANSFRHASSFNSSRWRDPTVPMIDATFLLLVVAIILLPWAPTLKGILILSQKSSFSFQISSKTIRNFFSFNSSCILTCSTSKPPTSQAFLVIASRTDLVTLQTSNSSETQTHALRAKYSLTSSSL
ncbi:hypothetical protein TorRG33x02_125650 [Trema orientale]|uniref:Transmembrane protein n=1 Tax=Trema orientale TaxID=63057 RepID=A0A2P5F1R5_TREOI|nr:hypothetical protein TorRG33x02_125650 [Trema orientale]